MTFDEFRDVWCRIFREVPEMVDLFHRLRKRYRTYVVSNTDSLHMPYVLKRFPWLNHFDGQALSYELGVRKPDPEFFGRTLEKFGLEARECVYIDDLEENVLAGRAAGIDSIHHFTVEETASELRKMGIEA
jgi:putative hydrolase of the HAD superfamily